MEDLGNRRMGEDLMAELIERHALGDRETANGDDLRGGISVDLHPEDLLRLGVVEDLEESGGALILYDEASGNCLLYTSDAADEAGMV